MKPYALIALLAIPAIAQVHLRTNIQDIAFNGECEEAGAVTFSVQSDEFPYASPSNPLFIRLVLSNQVKLSQTLVNLDGPGTFNLPIQIAMRLDGISNSATIQAPADTVSIVRWIRGERAIWIRIQRSSSSWLIDGGVPIGPGPERFVAFTVGVTARNSWARNVPEFPEYANLPANNRPGSAVSGEEASVSTLINVDLSESDLVPWPSRKAELFVQPELVKAVFSDVITMSDPNEIASTQEMAMFDNCTTNGRVTNLCAFPGGPGIDVTYSPNSELCKPATGELVYLETEITLSFPSSCWYRSAQLMLEIDPGSAYGFETESLISDPTPTDLFEWWGNDPFAMTREIYPVPGVSVLGSPSLDAYAPLDAPFITTSHGDRLSKQLIIEYDRFTWSPSLQIQFRLAQSYLALPSAAEIHVAYGHSSNSVSDWIGETPFSHAQDGAPPIMIQATEQTITTGSWIPCSGGGKQ